MYRSCLEDLLSDCSAFSSFYLFTLNKPIFFYVRVISLCKTRYFIQGLVSTSSKRYCDTIRMKRRPSGLNFVQLYAIDDESYWKKLYFSKAKRHFLMDFIETCCECASLMLWWTNRIFRLSANKEFLRLSGVNWFFNGWCTKLQQKPKRD